MPDLPRPLPRHSPQASCSLLARHDIPGRRGGGGGGRYGVPTPTLPPMNLLILQTPNNGPPPPPELLCRTPPFSGKGLSKEHGRGKGPGGFSRPITQPYSPPAKGRPPPPSAARADGRRDPWGEGSTVGVWDGYFLEQTPGCYPRGWHSCAGVCSPTPLPPDPPPCRVNARL